MWIPQVLNDYLHRHGSHLYLLESLLPPEDVDADVVLPPGIPALRRPYRATSCLSCLQCPRRPGGCPALLFGAHGVVHHHEIEFLTFNAIASKAVRSLLTALQWDEKMTSSEILDGRDRRLVCLECLHKVEGGIRGLEAFSWRQAARSPLPRNIYDVLMSIITAIGRTHLRKRTSNSFVASPLSTRNPRSQITRNRTRSKIRNRSMAM